tara:strand:+ start:1174 stop:1845 length:672 start_codon:yes stop_codon:yes gene_type:complete
MPDQLTAEIRNQIDSLEILNSCPLIICDADGVLVEFMFAFEAYLDYRGYYFDWSSFRLAGNVRKLIDGKAIENETVRSLLEDFYREKTEELEPLPGASYALSTISNRAQIVVLTNIPTFAAESRANCLRRHGMDFPVITGSGGKGPAVHRLSCRVQAPTLFIDDIPRNHTSVAQAAEHVTRIHFSADPRLKDLFGPSEDSQHFASDWTEAFGIIDRCLTENGY